MSQIEASDIFRYILLKITEKMILGFLISVIYVMDGCVGFLETGSGAGSKVPAKVRG